MSQLEKEKERLENQIEELKKEDPFLDPEHVSDNAAIDTDVREQVGHENIEAQVKNLEKKLQLIDQAIKNIKKDKYGICERCHQTIPQKRLELIPEALYCVDCEKKLRK